MQAECTTSVWDIINTIASVLGIISAFVTIIAACRTKRYAKSIVQAYSAESLVVANEKIEQAKDCYLVFRKNKYGNSRGLKPEKTQEALYKIESLLDEAEKKTPNEKSSIKYSISECKKTIKKCIENPSEQSFCFVLGSDLDSIRSQYQKAIEIERKETIQNLK